MILISSYSVKLLLIRACSTDLFNEPCAARANDMGISDAIRYPGFSCMSCRIKTHFASACQQARDLSMSASKIGPASLRKGMHQEGYTTRSQTHVASWGYLCPGPIDNDTVCRYCMTLFFRSFSLSRNSSSQMRSISSQVLLTHPRTGHIAQALV